MLNRSTTVFCLLISDVKQKLHCQVSLFKLHMCENGVFFCQHKHCNHKKSFEAVHIFLHVVPETYSSQITNLIYRVCSPWRWLLEPWGSTTGEGGLVGWVARLMSRFGGWCSLNTLEGFQAPLVKNVSNPFLTIFCPDIQGSCFLTLLGEKT